jgi:hypothetical protein
VPIHPGLSYAVDGVIEINQTCAVSGGCVAGDVADFPVTITSSGSYRLTSNLTVGDEDTTAISLDPGIVVTIDLNGFAIIGVTECTGGNGADLDCAPVGEGRGIDGFRKATILNGSVIGMGNRGIAVGVGSYIRGIFVTNNGTWGISTGAGSTVTETISRRNGGNGIHLNGGVASFNNSDENGANGINVLGSGAVVLGNSVMRNGVNGIEIDVQCTALDNNIHSNAGTGLVLGGGCTYARNTVTGNGATVSGGSEVGTNFCDGNTTCP